MKMYNGDSKRVICSHCGQLIVLPDELRHLQLQGRLVEFITVLYAAGGKAVPFSKLGRSRQAIWVQISNIKTALKDAGVPWRIESERDYGYKLIKTEQSK